MQTDAVTRKTPPGASRLRRWALALASAGALLAGALPAGAQSHHGGGHGGSGGPPAAPHGGGWGRGGGPPGPAWGRGGPPPGWRGPGGPSRGGPPPGWGRGPPIGGPWGPGPLPPRYGPGLGYYPSRAAPAPIARSWRRGGYLPPIDQSLVVGDYGRYHLRRPPFGYHWVQVGNQFMLVSSSTGLIFDVAPAF